MRRTLYLLQQSANIPTTPSTRATKNYNRIWMPNIVFKLINNPMKETNKLEYQFKVPPSMTKFEIKDYLTKIYGLNVRKVNTMNYDGKRKRRPGNINIKLPKWKKAIVFLYPEDDPNVLKIGT